MARTVEELERVSSDALLRDLGVERPGGRLDVRLHGAGVVDHRVPVRRAAAILSSVQEAVTAVAQAVTRQPTARGSVDRWIQVATELTLSPAASTGSVTFHLAESAQRAAPQQLDLGTTETSLVEDAVATLLGVLERGDGSADLADLDPLVEELRRLGPRTAKHLNDLLLRIIDDSVDVELTWQGTQVTQRVDVRRRNAHLLRDAIARNEQEERSITLTGRVVTVSTVTSVELVSDDGTRYKVAVPQELRPRLGRYFDRRVEMTVRELVTWSTSTGVERKTYDLVSLSDPEAPPEEVLLALAPESPAG